MKINVFKDIDSIPLGSSSEQVLTNAINQSDLMLVLIGEGWINSRGKDGRRRLEDPSDYIRFEIEHALACDVRIIPVLLGNVALPTDEQLPESIRAIRRFQVAVIRPDPDLPHDLKRLCEGILNLFPPSGSEKFWLRVRSAFLLFDCKNSIGHVSRVLFYIFLAYVLFLGLWAAIDISGAMEWGESSNYSDFAYTFIGGLVLIILCWMLTYSQRR